MQEIHCIVTGRVQMVMYRDFVQRHARQNGLVGYVKNMPDGTVKVIAQGNRSALEKLVEKLRQGSPLSRVADVRTEWRNPTQTFQSFTIAH